MEQEMNKIEFTIELIFDEKEYIKKVENIKFQDVIQTIKSLELQDYPIDDIWGENCSYSKIATNKTPFRQGSFLEVISKSTINEREYYPIMSKIPIMSFGGHRIIGYLSYTLCLTKTK